MIIDTWIMQDLLKNQQSENWINKNNHQLFRQINIT